MSEFIEFHNEDGQTVQMSRDEFREKILPKNLELLWDDKEELRQFAMRLLQDQFTEEASKAADRLVELWGPIEPALVFRSIVHLQAGEFDQAKTLLERVIEIYPESAPAYINLARLYAHEGQEEQAAEFLKRGLLIDPNEENGVNWIVASFMQLGKKEELFERLEELAQHEQAWRPLFVMAQISLREGDLLTGMNMYKRALDRVNGHEELVMNVTGELGQAGYPYQLIQIAEEYYKPTFIVPYTGFNYINALFQTDQKDKALQVLKELQENAQDQFRPLIEDFISKLPQELFEEPSAQVQTTGSEQTAGGDKKPWWKIW
ncbi:tetratricopeptide repeat protein [Brevibacillus dissolubilis]|uniref:tetratricopeptide repeat protein n=1 Tax=Brevibacillus dissolubilis TaxID=1844116 RepID=UPI001115BF31|nr:tetratricopeptide repeat protein [Brevibacillus dissolubilis]